MDIEKVIRGAGEHKSADALKKLLEGFISPAFGALPKSEVELLMLGALEDIGAISADPGVYELVSKLRVTRSRARKLIYERELRRLSVADLDIRVKSLLSRPIIQKAGEQFVLEVESPLVSDHLRSKVRALGHVSDGSFSPSVVKLPLEAIVALIEQYIPEAQRPAVKDALVAAGAPDTSLGGVLKSVLRKVASKVASDTGEALLDKTSEYLSPIIGGAVRDLTERISELYPVQNGDAS